MWGTAVLRLRCHKDGGQCWSLTSPMRFADAFAHRTGLPKRRSIPCGFLCAPCHSAVPSAEFAGSGSLACGPEPPARSRTLVLSPDSALRPTLLEAVKVAPRERIELSTNQVTADRSASELHGEQKSPVSPGCQAILGGAFPRVRSVLLAVGDRKPEPPALVRGPEC